MIFVTGCCSYCFFFVVGLTSSFAVCIFSSSWSFGNFCLPIAPGVAFFVVDG